MITKATETLGGATPAHVYGADLRQGDPLAARFAHRLGEHKAAPIKYMSMPPRPTLSDCFAELGRDLVPWACGAAFVAVIVMDYFGYLPGSLK